MTRPCSTWLCALALALLPQAASAGAPLPLVAEQVTVGNAATHLFGGTDADGGDRRLVPLERRRPGDHRRRRAAGRPGRLLGVAPRRQRRARRDSPAARSSTSAASGATATSSRRCSRSAASAPATSFVYDTIAASTDADLGHGHRHRRAARLRPGPAPASSPVVTEYSASGSDQFVTVTTTVTNTLGRDRRGPRRLPRRLHLDRARPAAVLAARPAAASRTRRSTSATRLASLEQPAFSAGARQRLTCRRRHRPAEWTRTPARSPTACSACSVICRPGRPGRTPPPS